MNTFPTLRLAYALAGALCLAACAGPSQVDSTARQGVPADASAPWQGHYEQLAERGRPVLRIDAARSLVTIEVRRGGRFAKLGHDHVVASHAVRGYIAPAEGRADLSIPLRDLVVDEPALREAAGLDTQPTATDIEGTRANMLSKVLHVDVHPYAYVALAGVRATAGTVRVEPMVTLNGLVRTVPADITIEPTPDGMRVTGRMTVLQTDFGLVPYSVLAGALEVQDALAMRFDLRAVALRGPTSR